LREEIQSFLQSFQGNIDQIMALVHVLLLICFCFPLHHASSIRSSFKRSIECEKDERVILDQNALELQNFGDESFIFPETLEEIEGKFCPRVKKASNCVRHFAHTCLRPLPRQLVKLYVADNKTAVDACQSTPDIVQNRVIPYFQCLNKILPTLHDCAKKAAHALNHINYHVAGINSEKRFAYTCREYHELSCCFQQNVKESCSPDVAEIAKVYFDRGTHSTANFLCRFYSRDSPVLKALPPLDLAHGYAESSSGYKHDSKSILVGLIDLYTRANDEYIDTVTQV